MFAPHTTAPHPATTTQQPATASFLVLLVAQQNAFISLRSICVVINGN